MALITRLAIIEAAMPSLVGPETSVFWDWTTSATTTSDQYAAQNDIVQVFVLAPDWVVDSVTLCTSATLGASCTLKVQQYDNDGSASNAVDLTAATTAASANRIVMTVGRRNRSTASKGIGLLVGGAAIGAAAKVSFTARIIHGPSWGLV